ncbi:hypothetical protein EDC04DRAFT_3088750, partial [Pisolithus marmoratus]
MYFTSLCNAGAANLNRPKLRQIVVLGTLHSGPDALMQGSANFNVPTRACCAGYMGTIYGMTLGPGPAIHVRLPCLTLGTTACRALNQFNKCRSYPFAIPILIVQYVSRTIWKPRQTSWPLASCDVDFLVFGNAHGFPSPPACSQSPALRRKPEVEVLREILQFLCRYGMLVDISPSCVKSSCEMSSGAVYGYTSLLRCRKFIPPDGFTHPVGIDDEKWSMCDRQNIPGAISVLAGINLKDHVLHSPTHNFVNVYIGHGVGVAWNDPSSRLQWRFQGPICRENGGEDSTYLVHNEDDFGSRSPGCRPRCRREELSPE